MELLKKIFPYSFTAKKDIASLIVSALIHLVVGLVVGVLIGILASIPIIGIIFGLVGGLVDLYILAAIVIMVLDYFKILK